MREKFLSFSTDALLNEALLASIQGRNQLRPFGEVHTATAGDSDEGVDPRLLTLSTLPRSKLKASGLGPTEIARKLKIGRASVYRVVSQRADAR